MGRTAKDKALIEMWNRRVELGLFAHGSAVCRHGRPGTAAAEQPQAPQWAEANRPKAIEVMECLDHHLKDRLWLAGDDDSIADITLRVFYDFFKPARLACLKHGVALRDWHARATAWPSAAAQ